MIFKLIKISIAFGCSLFAMPLGAQNFTTAAEVKPIVQATKGSWIAVRLWEGQDLLYFTNLLSWRCGLSQITYSVNDGEDVRLEMEPCYEDTATPNALKVENILPYVVFAPKLINSVTVSVTYDDGQTETESFERGAVRIN